MLNAADSRTKRVNRRRGLATLTLLITAVVIIACCALAMDVAFVSNKQVQLEVAVEAAARAAAAELIESGAILRAGWGEGAAVSPRILQAQEAAGRIATQNTVASRPVTLQLNFRNDPEGDTVVGWMRDPSDLGALDDPLDRCRSVEFRRSAAGANACRRESADVLVCPAFGPDGCRPCHPCARHV